MPERMPERMNPAPPLFAIAADGFLSDGVGHGPISQRLGGMRADWLAGVDHAPPWRIAHNRLGFEIAPLNSARDFTAGDFAAHFLPTGGLTGRALSITLDSHSASGVDLPPILRVVAQFTLSLAQELDSAWVAWRPARMAYPSSFLAEQLDTWRTGGLLPLLAFVHFGEDAGGATITRGLAFFGLPELRFTCTSPMAKGDQVRRIFRMAYAMMAESEGGGTASTARDWDGDYDGLLPHERITVRRRGNIINLASNRQE